MNRAIHAVGTRLAHFLSQDRHIHNTAAITSVHHLQASLRIGDVLLVEGNSRASTAVKTLTQSTWSHAALYVGNEIAGFAHGLVEADMVAGVRSIDIENFSGLHTRICRPAGLSEAECRQVAAYVVARIGQQYDLRNIIDLARYLLPASLVPSRVRRRALALGSGDPTRAICSTLIAQAFQAVHYPILPLVERRSAPRDNCPECVEEIYHVRHHSLFTPRDFDVSPYFQIIKPTLERAWDFKTIQWESGTEKTENS